MLGIGDFETVFDAAGGGEGMMKERERKNDNLCIVTNQIHGGFPMAVTQ